MQEDMHYYGTYAMARAAGLKVKDAKVVAYAAQYVDDSIANNSEVHKDGGMFEATASAHTNKDVIKNAAGDHTEQRHVWVPFHFFPGNEGKTLSEKLACGKDSALAQEMVKNHIRHAVSVKNEYGLTLMGVMAHVYADTFAHYGFSGVSSRNNKVDGRSFELIVKDPKVKAYIMGKMSSFLTKYTPRFIVENYRNLASIGANAVTGALGHGGVGTYPDRPFLKWRFNFEENNSDSGWRDNPATFLEACEKLHAAFSEYGEKAGIAADPVPFESIRSKVDKILRVEADKEGRIDAWIKSINNNELFRAEDDEALLFSKDDWEQQKDNFKYLSHSHEMKDREVYQFHQAAIYHRDYTLKNLLPKHGIVVL
ncbi:MAG: hypothetical protein COC19_02935 [SAR86 cluster bacterium]|uniref:Uncharacterized protein n=1 Tax=SAR86 cluster bacterium TaxID=2030880 RepID=A0A2A4MQ76_9GAMM|nr:MAG: hypothetical protein COC19_02935 [SAR86 cluster bacterium]